MRRLTLLPRTTGSHTIFSYFHLFYGVLETQYHNITVEKFDYFLKLSVYEAKLKVMYKTHTRVYIFLSLSLSGHGVNLD